MASEPSVGAGARNAVNIEKVEQVTNNFGPQVDSSLNSAIRDTLYGLLDEANSPHIVSMQTHPCYLYVHQGNPHLVDEVQVNVVVGAGGQGGGARHGEGDPLADEGVICSALDWDTVGDDFLVVGHFELREGTTGSL